MSNPDERHQSTAVLAVLLFLSLWTSHHLALWIPALPGTVDLQPWIRFWNKPLIINWPTAMALFWMSWLAMKRLHARLSAQKPNPPQKAKSPWDEFLPME